MYNTIVQRSNNTIAVYITYTGSGAKMINNYSDFKWCLQNTHLKSIVPAKNADTSFTFSCLFPM